ncbi:N-acetyltransferase [Chryseobacterium piscium]|uniref:N-acetyltransferase n=1 Tax=Chryseobacterium piscium TaxID=333702 RepID=A0A3D9BRT2_9FLAO|nr:GNAT family N-acetyltransferase [Chryseobacterium piscium]REC56233.1 N-acetyltransferase [Chryseobacterium piscium]
MSFLEEKCTLRVYDENILENCTVFDCGNSDLNEFFSKDLLNYTSELLGKSYCFTLDEDESQIVAAFTISNDSIKTFFLPNARKDKVTKKIPRPKHMRSYPAVLIGRLGVNVNFRNIEGEEKSIGDQLMDFIKSWFIDKGNKTGCRFIVVDSYNAKGPLRYYERNGFIKMFSTEDQEKDSMGIPKDKNMSTRLLFFDLIVLSK